MRYVVNAILFAGQDVSGQLGIPGIFDPNDPIATGGLPNIAIQGRAIWAIRTTFRIFTGKQLPIS